MAFDILYVNDESLLDLTLRARMTILERCLIRKSHLFDIVERKVRALRILRASRIHRLNGLQECRSASDVFDALDGAIQNRDEGIILKNLNSPYVPNERKGKWIKLKPDCIDSASHLMRLAFFFF